MEAREININETADSISARLNSDQLDKLANLHKNGANKEKEGKLPQRPEAARSGNEEAIEKSEAEDKPEWQKKMAEMIKPGDVVLPLWESDDVFDKENFWFLEEEIKEDDGEEILRLVLRDRDGSKLVYRDEKGDKINQGSFGRGWEHITPYFEDEDSYVDKLKTIREALERAEEAGDEYRVDKLADLLKQVYIFTTDFIEKQGD